MAGLSIEQAKELKADMIRKRNKALADYNKYEGAIQILGLIDGTVEIVEEKPPEGGNPDGETS